MSKYQDDVFDRRESNVRYYCRHFPGIFVSGSGAWLTTKEGRRILDLLCGAGSLNYGHNDPDIMRRVVDYVLTGGIAHSLDLHTESKERFLLDFESIILRPRGLDYKVQFPNATGTNAVEAALKLARKITGRRTVAAFNRGFHGMTLGSLAVSSKRAARASAGVPLENVVFWPYEGDLGPQVDTIDIIEGDLANRVGGNRPAAVIIELVQGDGGLRSASQLWFQRLAELCRANGMLLIVDDIQAGCGRTGSFFSFENMGVVPDIVLLSKALSGFGAPLSVVLMRRELDAWKPGEHNGTFRGNNLAFVGASAALEKYWKNADFACQVQARADRVHQSLSAMSSEAPGHLKVRGRGLLVGLEFEEKGLASRCSGLLFERGIMLETCGDDDRTLKLLPPLNIRDQDLTMALGQIRDVVSQVYAARLAVA